MSKYLRVLVPLVLLAQVAFAQTVENDLVGLGMKAEQAGYLAGILPGGSVLGNDTYLKGRNAANSADISVLKVDANDETVLNADAGDGFVVSVAGTPVASISSAGAGTFNGVTAANAAGTPAAISGSTITGTGAGTLVGLTVKGATTFANASATPLSSVHATTGAGTFNGLTVANAAGTPQPLTASTITGTVGTFTGGAVYAAGIMESVAAAGTGANSSDAGALATGKYVHLVTASDETKGVKLPACAAGNVGEVHFLLNGVANKFLRIWPNSGGAINGGSADAKIDNGAAGQGGKASICACQAANTWYCG